VTRKTPDAAYQEAVELLQAGRVDDARRVCRKLVKTRPDVPEVHLLLAEIRRQAGDAHGAQESASRALRLRPDSGAAHLSLGDVLHDLGRFCEAATSYRRAVELAPDLDDAHYKLILLLQQERHLKEMEQACRDGMVRSSAAFYPQRLGVALALAERHEEALAAFRVAAERAGTIDPKGFQAARLSEANALLSMGRSREGWEAYFWRSTRSERPGLVADPREIATMREARTICIIGEQGLGDELVFLRFAPLLKQRGHRLWVREDRKLVPLLAPLSEIFDRVEPIGDMQYGAADITLLSGDLPLATGEDIAPALALPVEARRRTKYAEELRRFGPPPYVGVTWRAGLLPDEQGPQDRNYWTKQVAPEDFAAALQKLDARIVILQRRPASEDLQRFNDALGRAALDWSAVNDDLCDATAALSLLDDYVGVSNTNMHLRAGLQDKTARVLIQSPPEWRWGLGEDRSPWFPAFRLYRQAAGGFGKALGDLYRDLAT
jgi:tetratricopeptide (TPR) repeat protein